MKTVKCPNVVGHYYDADKFDTCPHCMKAAGIRPVPKVSPVFPSPTASTKAAGEPETNKTDDDKDKKSARAHSAGLFSRFFGSRKEDNDDIADQPRAAEPAGSQQEDNPTRYSEADRTDEFKTGAVFDLPEDEAAEENESSSDDEKTEMLALADVDEPLPVPPVQQAQPVQPVQPVQPAPAALVQPAPISVSKQINRVAMSGNIGDIKTIAHFGFEEDIEPVVGWLAVVTTADKGTSFEIKNGRTTIGRSGNGQIVDVSLERDASVSRGAQATITYDPKKVRFLIKSNDANTLVYVNEELLMEYTELKAYDRIQLGSSELVFIPLCSDKFSWNEDD